VEVGIHSGVGLLEKDYIWRSSSRSRRASKGICRYIHKLILKWHWCYWLVF